MAVAVPNVMGTLRKSRDQTCAKKLILLAEYNFKTHNVVKPIDNNYAAMALGYLEFTIWKYW